MLKELNMVRIMRMLLIILSAVFLLTACSPGKDGEQAPMEQSDKAVEKATEDHGKCWQASIVQVLYETLGKASMEMYEKITKGALALMMVVFAIWFSYRILIHLSSVTEENIGEVWKEVLSKFFVCFACGYLASSPDMLLWTLNTLIFPLYNAFLEFGSAILAASAEDSSGGYSNVLGTTVTFQENLICYAGESTKATMQSGFPSGPMEMMSCMVCSISERVGIGQRLAFEILTGGDNTFLGWIISVIVFLCFTFVKLGFVFYLVDTLFRMAVMTIILPILIMSFAFKKTKEWTKKGFFIILNSAAFAALIAILMTTALLAMEEIFISNASIFDGNKDTKDEFNQMSVTFICILLICFLLVKSVALAGEISSSLVGVNADPKFQKKLKVILEMAVSWITGGASKSVKKVMSAAKAAKKN